MSERNTDKKGKILLNKTDFNWPINSLYTGNLKNNIFRVEKGSYYDTSREGRGSHFDVLLKFFFRLQAKFFWFLEDLEPRLTKERKSLDSGMLAFPAEFDLRDKTVFNITRIIKFDFLCQIETHHQKKVEINGSYLRTWPLFVFVWKSDNELKLLKTGVSKSGPVVRILPLSLTKLEFYNWSS